MTLTEFKNRMREEFLRNPSDTELSDDLLLSYYTESSNLVLQELMKSDDKASLPISEVYVKDVSSLSYDIELEITDYILWIDNTITCEDVTGGVFPINKTDINNLLLNKTVSGKPSFFTLKDYQKITLNSKNFSVPANIYYRAIKASDAKVKLETIGIYDNLILENGKNLCRNYLNLYRGN